MSITHEQIQSIAYLARLSLGADEAPQYAEGLSRVLALVAQLQSVDTKSVAPMAHPLPGLRARLRSDEVAETDRHELYQRNAPQVEAGLYLVPRVIE